MLGRLENDLSFKFFFSEKKEVTAQSLRPPLFRGTLCDGRNVL